MKVSCFNRDVRDPVDEIIECRTSMGCMAEGGIVYVYITGRIFPEDAKLVTAFVDRYG